MLYFRQVIMSQRYSWSGCRGLTEVTACSEDCRHRPELHSAAVMCSSLGRGRGCLGCCMIRCSHCSPGSMACSNPWPAASSLPCHVWPPHHWPACQVSHRWPASDGRWQPLVTSPISSRSLTPAPSSHKNGNHRPAPAGWLARLAWLAAAQNLSHFANPSPVSSPLSLRQRLRSEMEGEESGTRECRRKRAETGAGGIRLRQNNSQSDKIRQN